VVVQINERDAAAKVEKWNQIAIESIKQCGSPWLPAIESPVNFEKLVQRLSYAAPPTFGVPALAGPDPSRKSGDRLKPELQAKPTPDANLTIVCSLEEPRRTLREVLAEFSSAKQHRPQSALVWIGPEGDFTPAEYAAIAKLGAAPITLGPLVLRADTAAIATLAVLNYELQRAV
jgi:16S rRNA (uracil1498-N3)-methyltransferase